MFSAYKIMRINNYLVNKESQLSREAASCMCPTFGEIGLLNDLHTCMVPSITTVSCTFKFPG